MSENERPQPQEISSRMRDRMQAVINAGGPGADAARELLRQTVVREESHTVAATNQVEKKEESSGMGGILNRLHTQGALDEAEILERERAERLPKKRMPAEQPPDDSEQTYNIQVFEPKSDIVVAPAVHVNQDGVLEGEARDLPPENEKDEKQRKQFNDDLDLVLEHPDPEKEEEIRVAKARLRKRKVFLANGLNLDKPEDRKAYVGRKREIMRIIKDVRAGKDLSDDDQEVLRNVKIKPKDLVEEETELPKVETVVNEEDLAKENLKLYMSMPAGEDKKELLKIWLTQNPKVDPETLRNILAAMGEKEVRPAKAEVIPNDPIKYRKFMRERVIKVIKDAGEQNLTLDAVTIRLTTIITSEVGFDPTRVGGINIFPDSLAESVEEVKKEINARANLRLLQIRENGYKGQDKKLAVKRYISDMTGSESSAGTQSVVARETYAWLKNLDKLGDPSITTAKVDASLSILLRLGEDNPDFTDVPEFARFRVGDKNVYDPKYSSSTREEAFSLIATRYGADAKDLALQLFQAYKEEGNYNKNHYLYTHFKFAEARVNAVDAKTFIGSQRLYTIGQQEIVAGHIATYADEIPRLARSPLRAQAKVGVGPDGKDIKRVDVYLRRAIDGSFLQTTALDNEELVNKTPDQETFGEIKTAEKVKDAITNIGSLGKDSDRSNAEISKAEGFMGELRINGQELVDNHVITQEELDEEMLSAAKDVLFELTVLNPNNTNDLSRQKRTKARFLLPSTLPELLITFGEVAGDYRIISNINDFSELGRRIEQLRKITLAELTKGSDQGGMTYVKGDDDLVEIEKKSLKALGLPKRPGEGLDRQSTEFLLRGFQRVAKVTGLNAMSQKLYKKPFI